MTYKLRAIQESIGMSDEDFRSYISDMAADPDMSYNEAGAQLSERSGFPVYGREICLLCRHFGIAWNTNYRKKTAIGKLLSSGEINKEELEAFILGMVNDRRYSITDIENAFGERYGLSLGYAAIKSGMQRSLGTVFPRNNRRNSGPKKRELAIDEVSSATLMFATLLDMSGLSYRDVAQKVGVSREAVRQWRSGLSMPNKAAVELVCNKCMEISGN